MTMAILWAQAPGSLAVLALRRWYSSLTLSSPQPIPQPFGVWSWLGGLAAIFALALMAQEVPDLVRYLKQVEGF